MKTRKRSWFWPIIISYIVLGTYLLYIAYSNPYLGIELEKVNGQWRIDELNPILRSYEDPKNSLYISKGDIVISIDNISPHDISRLQYDPLIRGASEIVIKKSNRILHINFKQLDIQNNFYTLFLFPLIYFPLILFIAFYLNYRRGNIPQANLLILFNLSIAIAYISTAASGQANIIGLVVNSSFMILSLVLLLNFFESYFNLVNIKWLFTKYTNHLYILPICVAILRYVHVFYPEFSLIDNFLILSLFFILILYAFYILIHSYLRYRLPQIKWLFIGLIFPFIPFVTLYVLPYILLGTYILDAAFCALFLLLIPFNIIFLQLSERLFDFIYHITRFRYYFYLSLVFTSWLIIGVYLISDVSLLKLSWIAIFVFLSSILYLYIKERIDYYGRKVLFLTKGDNIRNLYKVIDKIGLSIRLDQMLQILTTEVMEHLEVKDVSVITYNYETDTIVPSEIYLSLQDITSIQQLKIGEIIRKENSYIALIHQDKDHKRWLIINLKSTRLKEEELLWLELLLIYTNSFIDSTKRIEQLIEELNQLQQTDINEPIWLKKLVWIKVEDEKSQLAQELHDTILQEYIHIARQVDELKYEKNQLTIESKLKNLHEQLILLINNLRTYCETLAPPLLTNVGLKSALERLFEQIAKQANFKLIIKIDRLYLEDEQFPLIIYRIVQELLNNALKHSQAEIVKLYLQELDNGFELVYRDNGIGCNVSEILNGKSMGLHGIRSRIEAFNGQMTINSKPNEGISIQIKFIEGGSEVFDFSINSG